MKSFDRKAVIGFAVFGVLIAIILLLLFPFGFVRYFTDRGLLIHLIREHRDYAAFIFVGLQVLQVVAAPVPGEVTGFAGGILFGTARGILYTTIGLTVGSWLAFNLARMAGRPLVEKVIKPETIRRYDYVMKHKGMFLAFLMFLVPGFPKDILCYVLGLGHMAQVEFLIVSTSGRLLGTVLLTLAGAFIRNRRYAAFFTVLGVGIAVVLLVMIFRETIERLFRRMRAAQRHAARCRRIAEKKKNEP